MTDHLIPNVSILADLEPCSSGLVPANPSRERDHDFGIS
jgi:hypothetical protein